MHKGHPGGGRFSGWAMVVGIVKKRVRVAPGISAHANPEGMASPGAETQSKKIFF